MRPWVIVTDGMPFDSRPPVARSGRAAFECREAKGPERTSEARESKDTECVVLGLS